MEEETFSTGNFHDSSLAEETFRQARSFKESNLEKALCLSNLAETAAWQEETFSKAASTTAAWKTSTFSNAASKNSPAWKRHFALATLQRTAWQRHFAQLERPAWQLSFEQPSFQGRTSTTELSQLERPALHTELSALERTALTTELAQLQKSTFQESSFGEPSLGSLMKSASPAPLCFRKGSFSILSSGGWSTTRRRGGVLSSTAFLSHLELDTESLTATWQLKLRHLTKELAYSEFIIICFFGFLGGWAPKKHYFSQEMAKWGVQKTLFLGKNCLKNNYLIIWFFPFAFLQSFTGEEGAKIP